MGAYVILGENSHVLVTDCRKCLILRTLCRAHNPKVGGSNPSPATKKRTPYSRGENRGFSLFRSLICAVSNNALIYAKRALYGHWNNLSALAYFNLIDPIRPLIRQGSISII